MLTTRQKEIVKKRDGNKCVKCGTTSDLTVDHIIPLSKGGTDDFANLTTLCFTHNAMKANNHRSIWKQIKELWSNYYGSARWRKEIDMRINRNNKHVEKVVQDYMDKVIRPKFQSLEDKYKKILVPPPTKLPEKLTNDCTCGHPRTVHVIGIINLCTRCSCSGFKWKHEVV